MYLIIVISFCMCFEACIDDLVQTFKTTDSIWQSKKQAFDQQANSLAMRTIFIDILNQQTLVIK